MTIRRAYPAARAPWAAYLLAAALVSGCASRSPMVSLSFDSPRNQIVIDASVAGGAASAFMIDSGVDPSVVDLGMARRFRLLTKGGARAEAAGAGDGEGIEIHEARLENLVIADRRFGDFDAVAADLSPYAARLGRDLGGVLGYSFLKGRAVRIDYAQSRVDIAPSADDLPPLSPPPRRRFTAPLQFVSEADRTPAVDIVIDGETLRVSIDTGSSLGVELYASAQERLGLSGEGAEKEILGARGAATVRESEVRNIAVGPLMVAASPASFSSRRHAPAERTGNLGNKFLGNFVLTLDYAAREIIFEMR